MTPTPNTKQEVIEKQVEEFKMKFVEHDGTMYMRMQQPTEFLLDELRQALTEAYEAGQKEGIHCALKEVKEVENMPYDGPNPDEEDAQDIVLLQVRRRIETLNPKDL